MTNADPSLSHAATPARIDARRQESSRRIAYPQGTPMNLLDHTIESSLFPNPDALEVILHSENQMRYQYPGSIDARDELGVEDEMQAHEFESSTSRFELYSNNLLSEQGFFDQPHISYDAPMSYLSDLQLSRTPQGPIMERNHIHIQGTLQEHVTPTQVNSDDALSPSLRYDHVADAFPGLSWLIEPRLPENLGSQPMEYGIGDFQPNSDAGHNQSEDLSWLKEAENGYDHSMDFDSIPPIEVFPGGIDTAFVENNDSSTGASLTPPSDDSAHSNQLF